MQQVARVRLTFTPVLVLWTTTEVLLCEHGPLARIWLQGVPPRSQAAQSGSSLDVHTKLQVDVPHLRVEVDLAKALRYGLKPGDVRRAAATLVAGTEVSDIHRDGKVYDVMVWGRPQARDSLSSIRDLLIVVGYILETGMFCCCKR